ncbi:hypothetical protein FOWG_18214 [Fusarium oxysporum f. sp. lycopersici MN25]|nr:hypothetical protein FOWG_18214 [Fusarium oxysporum f. sp. lycopersici MN25]
MLFQLCERTGTTDFSGAKKEFDSATQRDRQSESIDPNNTCFVAGPVGSFCSYRQGTFVIRDLLGTICTARPVCFLLSAAGLADTLPSDTLSGFQSTVTHICHRVYEIPRHGGNELRPVPLCLYRTIRTTLSPHEIQFRLIMPH